MEKVGKQSSTVQQALNSRHANHNTSIQSNEDSVMDDEELHSLLGI